MNVLPAFLLVTGSLTLALLGLTVAITYYDKGEGEDNVRGSYR